MHGDRCRGRTHARDLGAWIAEVNQLGGNDELVFDGVAVFAPRNGPSVTNGFATATPLIVDTRRGEAVTAIEGAARAESINADPIEPDREVIDILTLGVRDYVEKTGHPGVVIGLSGGIDSALVATLAVRALGPDRVLGLLMPGPYSSEHSVSDALDLADRLAIRAAIVPITDVFAAGEAARIFTGAPVPAGADSIIVQEEVVRDGDHLTLTGEGPPRLGAHIRKTGRDFAAESLLLAAGTQLNARHIGLAAAAGHGALYVSSRPRVTLVATGNELVPPGSLPGPGQIVGSNGVMLRLLLEGAGADVHDLGILPDRLDTIADAIRQAVAGGGTDLLITIGGASVGDHDLAQAALKTAGADIDFWKVAIKPGKPLIAGGVGRTRVIGLPGNPVSAYVCAVLFALPMLRRMQGAPAEATLFDAPLLSALPANGARRDHLRARLTPAGVAVFDRQDSSMLRVLAEADALVVRPPHAPAADAGQRVPVLMLDRAWSVP